MTRNPSIPETEVSGATTGCHFATYAYRLTEVLGDLCREVGYVIPGGTLAVATNIRIQMRFNLGIRPEDAAAELFADFIKPRLGRKMLSDPLKAMRICPTCKNRFMPVGDRERCVSCIRADANLISMAFGEQYR